MTCSTCGAELLARARFCGICGTPAPEPVVIALPPVPASRRPAAAGRRPAADSADEPVIRALLAIRRELGDEIFDQPERLRGAIADFLPGSGRAMARVRKRLAEAAQLGVYRQLREAAGRGELAAGIERAVRTLVEEDIAETRAREIAYSFAALFAGRPGRNAKPPAPVGQKITAPSAPPAPWPVPPRLEPPPPVLSRPILPQASPSPPSSRPGRPSRSGQSLLSRTQAMAAVADAAARPDAPPSKEASSGTKR